ncbi:MAG: triose-phosphate isomerase [Patescibacteria group bacterium]|nr:triose-phosphate isomerase [Patescibacteria group bacterium]
MNKKLVIGNWKENPSSVDDAKRIAGKTRAAAGLLERVQAVVCPPFPFIPVAVPRKPSANYAVGAQSVSREEGGAHTGQVSAAMLRSLGLGFVIVGHSEERAAGDTDGAVSAKASRALEAGLTAVLCVGEQSRDESGSHFDFVRNEIKASLAGIPAEKARHIVLAYEPIWAIGAKEPMAPADIHEMSIFVKKAFADVFGAEVAMKTKVLYGGAVNFRNAAEIVTTGGVDGLLVGRESVNLPGFIELLKSVDKIQ